MKKVSLVEPYQYGFLPFQKPIFDLAKKNGYNTEYGHRKFPRITHYFLHHWPVNFHLPFLRGKSVKLLLISGTHPGPMVFPYAYRNELIPVIWDCWPKFRRRIHQLLKFCDIKLCFFTQSENVEYFRKEFPYIRFYYLPEAIVINNYIIGKELKYRDIDILEYGRSNGTYHEEISKLQGLNHVYPKEGNILFSKFSDLTRCISNSKLTIAYPRNITSSDMAGKIETLTQRYWENMYSGTLMVGHAPEELVDLIGYNPVIETDRNGIVDVVSNVLSHLDHYQVLANRNIESAKKYGDWKVRLKSLQNILYQNGYIVSEN